MLINGTRVLQIKLVSQKVIRQSVQGQTAQEDFLQLMLNAHCTDKLYPTGKLLIKPHLDRDLDLEDEDDLRRCFFFLFFLLSLDLDRDRDLDRDLSFSCGGLLEGAIDSSIAIMSSAAS